MEIVDRATALIHAVEQARSIPMSSNCIVNRKDLLAALEALKNSTPQEINDAQKIINERDDVIAGGQQEAERLINEGKLEAARLVSTHEVTLGAEAEAGRIVGEARAEADRLREEIEKYVETSLANFEQLLQRTLEGVQRGRGRMSAVMQIDGADSYADDKPLPAVE